MRKRKGIVLAAIMLLVLFFAYQRQPYLVKASEANNEISSKGNLIYDRSAIEFYSEDVINIEKAMDDLNQILRKGKELIKESLGIRNVAVNSNLLFTQIPESIIAVEQKVYLGAQKVPAKIQYLYHNHSYQGSLSNDQLSEMIVSTPDGCYTKEVYSETGQKKGYSIGCGYVEMQIIGADIIEIR